MKLFSKQIVQFSIRSVLVFTVGYGVGWQSHEWLTPEVVHGRIPPGTRVISLKFTSMPPGLAVGSPVDILSGPETVLRDALVYSVNRDTVALVVDDNADFDTLLQSQPIELRRASWWR